MARRAINASRSSPTALRTRRRAALPGEEVRRAVALHRGVFSVDGGVESGSSALHSHGKSARAPKNSPTRSPGWNGLQAWADAPCPLREPLVRSATTTTSRTPIDAPKHPGLAGRRALQPQSRAALRRLEALGLDRVCPRRHGRGRDLHKPSGTTRPAPGRRTTASASTTSFCRRRRPTDFRPPRSTSACAPGKSLRITYR